MFTGIVLDVASVTEITKNTYGLEYTIKTNIDLSSMPIGASIAIDGACHSITFISKPTISIIKEANFTVFSSIETLTKTIVSDYKINTQVNLELPIKMGDFIGGHNVTGHIDCVALVEEIVQDLNGRIIKIKIPDEFAKYIVYKGSIAINGISLTVNNIQNGIIELYIIPVTLEKTNISKLYKGSKVNVEVDIMAKHIEKLMQVNR